MLQLHQSTQTAIEKTRIETRGDQRSTTSITRARNERDIAITIVVTTARTKNDHPSIVATIVAAAIVMERSAIERIAIIIIAVAKVDVIMMTEIPVELDRLDIIAAVVEEDTTMMIVEKETLHVIKTEIKKDPRVGAMIETTKEEAP